MNTNLLMCLSLRWFTCAWYRQRLYEAYGYMTEARAGWAREAKAHAETRERLETACRGPVPEPSDPLDCFPDKGDALLEIP